MIRMLALPLLAVGLALSGLAGAVRAAGSADGIDGLQEVSLADALDTPGWMWEGLDGGEGMPFGAEDPAARGGAHVVLPNRAGISTHVPGEGIVRIRFNGLSEPTVSVEGERVNVVLMADDPEFVGSDHQIGVVLIPSGGGTLLISTWRQIEVDYVEWIPPPASIAATLGLPDTITSGGTAIWVPAPAHRLGKYVAALTVTEASPEGWFEFPVTGPAEVAVSSNRDYSGSGIELFVDGQTVWFAGSQEGITIEVPAGTHTLRCHGRKSAYHDSYLQITGMTVTPLATEGKLGAAMDQAAAWASWGGWELSATLAHDGEDALQPLVPADPPSPIHESQHVLRKAVNGPGYVRFMSYLLDTPESSYSAPMSWGSDVHASVFRRFSDEPQGWQQHTLWYPPGEHYIRWGVIGNASDLSRVAIDQLTFEASETLAFDEVVGDVDGIWENDPDRPWTGVRKDPGGGAFIISPIIGPDEPTRRALAVAGPGTLRFHWSNGAKQDTEGEIWINGVKRTPELPYYQEGEAVILAVPEGGEVTIEWKFTARFGGNWAAMSDIEWTPWPEVALTEALDTPLQVAWETSGELPFKGRTDSSAINGSAAQVGLLPGEETWLEATVTGPGLFDFWFRGVPGALNDPRVLEWELFVDGVKSYIPPTSSTWPAQWLLGPGVHKIRLVFRNNTEVDGPAFIAVDDVSWQPLVPAQGGEGWTASHPELVDGFSNGGLDDGPQHVVPVATGEVRWIEKTVTGPGVLEWTTRLTKGRHVNFTPQVVIDGVCALPLEGMSEWKTKRLHIPGGVHTVRWISEPEFYSDEPYRVQTDAIWQISNVRFTPGVSPLMLGIDDEEMFWLAVGDAAGSAVGSADAHDGEDAWALGDGTLLYLCNTTPQGIKARGMVARLDGNGGEPQWVPMFRWAAPGQSVEWARSDAYGSVTDEQSCVVDQFTMEQFEITTFDEAVDAEEAFVVNKWVGLADVDNSYDGADAAWSYLGRSYGSNTVSTTVQGPAKMRFRWRSSGTGSLGLRVDGAWLPVAVPGGDWQEVELEVYQAAFVEWVHARNPETSYEAPGEAWLDLVMIESLPPRTISSLAGEGSGLVFESTADAAEADQWRGAAYRDATGQWRQGARGITGAAGLQTTVTGPTLLSFRSYCGRISIPGPPVNPVATQSIIGIGPGGYYITQRFLSVKIGDSIKLKIIPEEGEEWTDHLVYIPEGEHRVVWQLDGVKSFTFSSERAEEWQAWVGDVGLQSPHAHYEAWADRFLDGSSARQPGDDADGDEVMNFIEYAYGSEPGDKLSKPAEMFAVIQPEVSSWPPKQRFAVYIPRPLAHVPAVLQVSDDFETWTPAPIPVRSYLLLQSEQFFFDPPDVDVGEYQVISFDIAADQPALFVRIKF